MNNVPTWVVYSTPKNKTERMLVICEKREWDLDRPRYNTLVQDGFLCEADAEKFVRRELSLIGSMQTDATLESKGKPESVEFSMPAPPCL